MKRLLGDQKGVPDAGAKSSVVPDSKEYTPSRPRFVKNASFRPSGDTLNNASGAAPSGGGICKRI